MFRVIDTKTGERPDAYQLHKILAQSKWADNLILDDIDGFYIGEDGTLIIIDDCGNVAYPPEGRFRIEWESEGEHEQ